MITLPKGRAGSDRKSEPNGKAAGGNWTTYSNAASAPAAIYTARTPKKIDP